MFAQDPPPIFQIHQKLQDSSNIMRNKSNTLMPVRFLVLNISKMSVNNLIPIKPIHFLI